MLQLVIKVIRRKYPILFRSTVILVMFCISIILLNEIIKIGNINTFYEEKDLSNYLWLPSSIMQSMSAIFALSIAVFILIIQKCQDDICTISSSIRTRFIFIYTAIGYTISYNGFVLFIFSYYKPVKYEIDFLYFISLISLPISLLVIAYISYWMTCKAAGLKTPEEIFKELEKN
jgi:hypothetical protein